MTSYTKSMMESLAEVRGLIVEDNMDLMRKAAGGAMQTIKMKDGKLKMDSFTASAMMQVYDNVNPANKKKIETIINSGKKNQMMKLQSMAMKAIKSGYGEETDLDEAYELGTDEYREYLEKLTPGQIEEEISELDNLIKELDEGILGNIAKAAGKSVAKGVKVGAKKVGAKIKRKAGGSKIGKAYGRVKSGIQKTKEIGGKIKKAAKTGKAYGDEYDPMLERLEIIETKLNDYYKILEELDLEGVDLDEASARADAMRAMRGGKKEVDPADVDVDATDDDIKGASKNIIMQMRKAVSMRGKFPVEFADKKKVKIPTKVAQAVQDKYNSFRKPADKEKFQAQVAKSYKDMLRVLKAGYHEEVELDEALPSHLKKFFDKDGNPKSKEGKAAWERLAKMKGFKKYTSKQVKMAIGIAFDKRYVQGNMTGAVNAIEKIAKGLSEIEPVANALRRANEEVVKEATWLRPKGVHLIGLRKLLTKPIKLGKDGDNAIEAISHFIGDDELFDDLHDVGKKDPNGDARPVIRKAMKRFGIKEETILGRIDAKLKERKNG